METKRSATTPRPRRAAIRRGLAGWWGAIVLAGIFGSLLGGVEGAWSDSSYSVMSGRDSYFAPATTVANIQLPDTLRTRYKQPEALHPNLRFWLLLPPASQDLWPNAQFARIYTRGVLEIGLLLVKWRQLSQIQRILLGRQLVCFFERNLDSVHAGCV